MAGARRDRLCGQGVFRHRRAHRPHLDQGADREPAGRGPLAGGRARHRAGQPVRPAAQDHRRGARVQGPGRGRARRSVDRAPCGRGRFAEADRRRSAHRLAARFRDALRRLAGGAAARRRNEATSMQVGSISAGIICRAGSTANSRSHGTSASWSSPPTIAASCCARRSRRTPITRAPLSAAACFRSPCLPAGPGSTRYLATHQLAADAVIQESTIRYLAPVRGASCARLSTAPAARAVEKFRKMLRACRPRTHSPARRHTSTGRRWRLASTACSPRPIR